MKKKIIVPTALLLVISLFANTAVFAAPMHSNHGAHHRHEIQQSYHGHSNHYPPRPQEHHQVSHSRHHSHSDAGTIVAASVFGALVIGLGIAAAVSD